MHGQVGRSLLRHFIGLRERKVRTLKGSEPANGGAFEDLRSQVSDLRVSDLRFENQISDLRSGILRRRQVQQKTDQSRFIGMMGEMVRPLAGLM